MNSRLEYLVADESDESDEDDLLSYYAAVHRPAQTRKSWTAFSDADFIRISRFEKSDFESLRRALRIPDQVNTGNRLTFDGRTTLLITLRRMVYVCRLSDVATQFDISEQQVSECVATVIEFVYKKWRHRLDFHRSRFGSVNLRRYDEVVARTGCPLKRCVGFIDGT